MSYENAPATKMLCTHCAICGRPLVDAVSVNLGMGPDCREKYGFNIEVDELARELANELVCKIAQGNMTPGELLCAVLSLRVYGFHKLAATVLDRKATVSIEDRGDGTIAVSAPYSPAFVDAIRAASPWRKWDGANKVWVMPAGQQVRNRLWAAMKRTFPGTLGVGPNGPFEIRRAA